MKLGTILLRDGSLSLSQLEEALRTQTLSGGRLGTNLLELGFIDLHRLGEALSRLLGIPLATVERLESVDKQLLERFDPEIAAHFAVVPLNVEGDPPTLSVVMADPRPELVQELSRVLEMPVHVYVAAELRVYYYMEKYFGIPRPARMIRLAESTTSPGAGERRRQEALDGKHPPPSFVVEPTSPNLKSGRRRPTIAGPPIETTYLQAAQALEIASHRDEVAEALLSYASGRFAVTFLMNVRGQNAVGWRLLSRYCKEANVDHVLIPLGSSSALQVAHDTQRPYRGGAVSAGAPAERVVWDLSGTKELPSELFVAPIVVHKRVVNLLYVQPDGTMPLVEDHCSELAELSVRASKTYVRLLLATKVEQ